MNGTKSAQKLVRLSRFLRFSEPSLIRVRWQSFCFYIKPQLMPIMSIFAVYCFFFCFYIKPQPAVVHHSQSRHCFFFCFYIKPQLTTPYTSSAPYCFFFCFYIKPQRRCRYTAHRLHCFFFCFYIKPQLSALRKLQKEIVSSSVSTSNHNSFSNRCHLRLIVSSSVSTSNHNKHSAGFFLRLLFLLLFLHQTTTSAGLKPLREDCFFFCFYIKPQLPG